MEMANVFNRKLFKRKSETAARDKLRSMGGIMASSEPLIREAMKTVQSAPKPQVDIQGIMQAQKRMGAIPATPLPQVAPSMAQISPQPQMQAAPQPAPQPQVAPQPAPQQSMNPMQKQGFFLGGLVGDPATKARLAANTATPEERARTNALGIDVSRQAGSVVQQPGVNMDDITPDRAIQLTSAALNGQFPVNLRPFTAQTAGSEANAKLLNDKSEQLAAAMSDQSLSDEDRARNLLSALGGDVEAKSVKKALAKTSEQVFGKKLDSEAKIDAMNNAITGFAIAAGTSPRATKNIANGMLVGLKAMKQTEQGRVDTQNALAIAAAGGGKSGVSPVEPYIDRVSMFAEEIMKSNPGTDPVKAMEQAKEIIGPLYAGSGAGPSPGPTGPSLTPEQQQLLSQAQQAIDSGRDPAAIRQMLIDKGVPAGAIK